jgi:hypothetical protein
MTRRFGKIVYIASRGGVSRQTMSKVNTRERRKNPSYGRRTVRIPALKDRGPACAGTEVAPRYIDGVLGYNQGRFYCFLKEILKKGES